MVEQRGWGSCTHGDSVGQCAPEWWAPWYGVMLEQCWESCSLWEGYAGSVWEGQHLWEGPHMEQGQRETVEEHYNCLQLIPLHCLGGGSRRGWTGGDEMGNISSLLAVSSVL